MNILGTGLTGLVGTRLSELFASHFSVDPMGREQGIDITSYSLVEQKVLASNAEWIFHLAAYTDVDKAELDRPKGKEGLCWKINVGATENLVALCQKTNKRLLYVSTDYVFSGTQDSYTEEDIPDPEGWYGVTKYEGEKRVKELGDKALIVRIANPYRAGTVMLEGIERMDFVHKILERLQKRETVSAPDDQTFIPTFVDDIGMAINKLVEAGASGTYHVVGGDVLSPFEGAKTIAKVFGIADPKIASTDFATFFQGRAPRPFHGVLVHDKITKLGVAMRPFEEGLAVVKGQETKGS
jgi:dTDP-4-dehydrorhamnose reductase